MEKKQNFNTTIRFDEPVAPQVYLILRRQIIRGRFTPGTRLSEAEISQMLEISRQPVREAFIKLQHEDLVEIRSYRGTFVTKISLTAVNNARFIREAIEADIAKLLAATIDDKGCTQLEVIIKKQRQLGNNDLDQFATLDEDFHRTLAVIAGKGQVWKFISDLKTHFDRVRYMSSMQKPITRLIDQHQEILDFLTKKDGQGVEKAMRNHLREAQRDLPIMQSLQPDYFIDR